MRINRRSQLLHDRGERVFEIFVLAPAEGVARHVDARAELAVVVITRGDRFASIRNERIVEQSESALVELGQCAFPIDIDQRSRCLQRTQLFSRYPVLKIHPTTTRQITKNPSVIVRLTPTLTSDDS